VDINPTKLVKGQWISKLLAKSNCRVLGINFISKAIIVEELEYDDLSQPSYKVVLATTNSVKFYHN
jgi:hypothetical protein